MNKLDPHLPTAHLPTAHLPTDLPTHRPTKPIDKLVVENLHLQYGDNPILKGVSMTLNPGEVVALLGASGSGKTTLLRSVAGLEQPSRGRITIGDAVLYDSEAVVDMPVEKRNLGLVFQSYALWPHRSVFDNVAYALRLRGIPVSEIKERVNQALTNLGLGALAKRLPHQLSGGEQPGVRVAPRAGVHPAGGADGRAFVQPRREAARGGARVVARIDRPAR